MSPHAPSTSMTGVGGAACEMTAVCTSSALCVLSFSSSCVWLSSPSSHIRGAWPSGRLVASLGFHVILLSCLLVFESLYFLFSTVGHAQSLLFHVLQHSEKICLKLHASLIALCSCWCFNSLLCKLVGLMHTCPGVVFQLLSTGFESFCP